MTTQDTPRENDSRKARAARVRAARAWAGIDQATLGEALGKSVYTVKRLERGARDITDAELEVIAQACRAPLSFLVAGFLEGDPDQHAPLTVGAAERFFANAVTTLTARIEELERLVETRTGEEMAEHVRDALNQPGTMLSGGDGDD